MLFNKKTQPLIQEKQIKEDFKNNEGAVLLKVNLKYPQLKCQRNDPLKKYAVDFYEKLSKGFYDYAKGELFPLAKMFFEKNKESFMPFSALMKWECTFENPQYLSIMTDVSVSDGINPPYLERQTQIWDKINGTKCGFNQLFQKDEAKKEIKAVLEKEEKAFFDKELFILREETVDFLLRRKDGYSSISLPKALLRS